MKLTNSLALMALLVASFGSNHAVAEQLRPPVGEPLPCGKAQAMARDGNDCPEEFHRTEALSREAMSETDVLNYALDIEVSNLNPGANNCTVAGTNAITVRSKSATLTVTP